MFISLLVQRNEPKKRHLVRIVFFPMGLSCSYFYIHNGKIIRIERNLYNPDIDRARFSNPLYFLSQEQPTSNTYYTRERGGQVEGLFCHHFCVLRGKNTAKTNGLWIDDPGLTPGATYIVSLRDLPDLSTYCSSV